MLKIFSTAEHSESRFWEVDFLRGIAIVMMIASNCVTDLDYFNFYKISQTTGFWWIFARTTAAIFVFLVGVSLTISYSRAQTAHRKPQTPLWLKFVERGLKIFSWGLIITLVSWAFMRGGFVVFGVLQLIGLSIILSYPFLSIYPSLGTRLKILLLGLVFISIGIYSPNVKIGSDWLLWLGFASADFYSIDYLPLFPWFGVVLIGIFAGYAFYPRGKRLFKISDLGNSSLIKSLTFLGRNSLFIYLLHQPILLLTLKILGTQGVVA